MGSAAIVSIAAAACSGVVSGHTAAALNTEPFSVTAGDVVHHKLPPCAPLTRSGLRPPRDVSDMNIDFSTVSLSRQDWYSRRHPLEDWRERPVEDDCLRHDCSRT